MGKSKGRSRGRGSVSVRRKGKGGREGEEISRRKGARTINNIFGHA